jgi:hypothetical protein
MEGSLTITVQRPISQLLIHIINENLKNILLKFDYL